MNCEICGKNPAIYHATIEGTTMNVCTDCSKYGSVKGKSNVKIVVVEKKKPEFKEPEFLFVPGYGQRVKNAREKLKLNMEDMAKKLSERESVMHQIESEHFKPSIEVARKIEKALHITILEEIKDENPSQNLTSKKGEGLTLGDFVKKR